MMAIIVYFSRMVFTAPDIDILEKMIKSKVDAFVNMQVWPAGEKLRPYKWLENFTKEQKEHSLYLLNSFVYYNKEMCIALLKSSIVQLSGQLHPLNTLNDYKTQWNKFIAETVFIPCTGENRNITDSGNILAGYLRRDLLIPQTNIMTVDQLYDSAYSSVISDFSNILFFDDFVGSGKQFVTMWTEDFEKDSKLFDPVGKQCQTFRLNPFYCAMVATEYGKNNIQAACPDIKLHFAHVLPANISPLHPDSKIWPAHLKKSGPEFVKTASIQAGILTRDVAGFHNLGLSLAFEFTIPDATLPIFRWNQNGWNFLMQRS